MRLVTCDAFHPGTHKQTAKCINPKRETVGSRIVGYLERKLNPKQGRQAPSCQLCGNGLIDHHVCLYCGAIVP